MDAIALREKLHDYIDTADEQHLSAIYVLVEGNIQSSNEKYDDAILDMLEQRVKNHELGISKSYTMEESFKLIRQGKKSR